MHLEVPGINSNELSHMMIKFTSHVLWFFFLPIRLQLLEGRDFFSFQTYNLDDLYMCSHSDTYWLKLWPSENQGLKILKTKGTDPCLWGSLGLENL